MNRQINEEACEWFVRMRDVQAAPVNHDALMAWLKRSPDHVSAYLDIAAIWQETGSVHVDSELDLSSRIARARADSDIAELLPDATTAHHPRVARKGFRLGMAAAVLVTLAAAGWLISNQRKTDVYTTQLGELRSIALPDGSRIELDALSSIRVGFDDTERRITLVEGHALFRTARDPNRPFIVDTRYASVRAVGTAFDVNHREGAAIVTVLEGAVAVRPQASPSDPLLLSAGNQVTIEQGATSLPHRVDVAAASAWTRHQLVFDFTPLAQAAEEFNRHNVRKLIVRGAALRDYKISAIFESPDPTALVQYLRDVPGVSVTETEDGIVIAPAGPGDAN